VYGLKSVGHVFFKLEASRFVYLENVISFSDMKRFIFLILCNFMDHACRKVVLRIRTQIKAADSLSATRMRLSQSTR
jgi:hypothetical protein